MSNKNIIMLFVMCMFVLSCVYLLNFPLRVTPKVSHCGTAVLSYFLHVWERFMLFSTYGGWCHHRYRQRRWVVTKKNDILQSLPHAQLLSSETQIYVFVIWLMILKMVCIVYMFRIVTLVIYMLYSNAHKHS